MKIEIDNEAFDRVYGHKSHAILVKNEHQKIAVRVISQFGEESAKVLQINQEINQDQTCAYLKEQIIFMEKILNRNFSIPA